LTLVPLLHHASVGDGIRCGEIGARRNDSAPVLHRYLPKLAQHRARSWRNACRSRMLCGPKPIRTGPAGACGRWARSGTAKGVDHAWSGGAGNQNEGAFPVMFPVLFPVCSQSRCTRTADNRPCSQCPGFSKPSLRWGARVFTSLFINLEQKEQWEHEEESTTYRQRSAGNTRGTHGTRNTPDVKQRSNAVLSPGCSLMGHAHHTRRDRGAGGNGGRRKAPIGDQRVLDSIRSSFRIIRDRVFGPYGLSSASALQHNLKNSRNSGRFCNSPRTRQRRIDPVS
jgi:hypothetical protein